MTRLGFAVLVAVALIICGMLVHSYALIGDGVLLLWVCARLT